MPWNKKTSMYLLVAFCLLLGYVGPNLSWLLPKLLWNLTNSPSPPASAYYIISINNLLAVELEVDSHIAFDRFRPDMELRKIHTKERLGWVTNAHFVIPPLTHREFILPSQRDQLLGVIIISLAVRNNENFTFVCTDLWHQGRPTSEIAIDENVLRTANDSLNKGKSIFKLGTCSCSILDRAGR